MVPVNSIQITTRWPRARGNAPIVVVPDGEDPCGFDFAFVAGLEVVITADTRAHADAIAQAVAAYLPKLLLGAVQDPPSIVPYIRSDGKPGVLA